MWTSPGANCARSENGVVYVISETSVLAYLSHLWSTYLGSQSTFYMMYLQAAGNFCGVPIWIFLALTFLIPTIPIGYTGFTPP